MLPSIQSDADFLLIYRRSLTLPKPLLFLLAGAHPETRINFLNFVRTSEV